MTKITVKKANILRNVKSVLKHKDISKLNKPTYEFLHLNCGTIAHYSLYGWQDTYKDLRDFVSLFLVHNEYGKKLSEEITEPHLAENRYEWQEVAPAEIIAGIIELCEKYKDEVYAEYDERERQAIKTRIKALEARASQLNE